MSRLTFEGNFCDICVCQEVPCKYPDTGCSQKQVWERLKAYEDTGLEPEQIHGWISVEDDLPEDDVSVLCVVRFFEYTRISVGAYYADEKAWVERTTNCEHPADETVTHWMPLPELPKEVRNGGNTER